MKLGQKSTSSILQFPAGLPGLSTGRDLLGDYTVILSKQRADTVLSPMVHAEVALYHLAG